MKKMIQNLDKTFCEGDRCDRKESCSRWMKNLTRWISELDEPWWHRPISTSQFADHTGKCEMYMEQKYYEAKNRNANTRQEESGFGCDHPGRH